MTVTDQVAWRKSSYCDTSTCVELAAIDGSVAMRDSKNPLAGYITFSPHQWRDFLMSAKSGTFGTP